MNKDLAPIFFSIMIALAGSCTHETKTTNPPSGDVVQVSGAQTFQATYRGRENLQVGDKVRIMSYDFGDDFKSRSSRLFPLSSNKKQIGEATVSGVLSDHYYELKTTRPLPMPGDAFIEKL